MNHILAVLTMIGIIILIGLLLFAFMFVCSIIDNFISERPRFRKIWDIFWGTSFTIFILLFIVLFIINMYSKILAMF